MKIKVGITGYGNIGRGAELAVAQCPDMELAAVLTRRNPKSLQIKTPGVPVLPVGEAQTLKGEIDVMLLCGGSASDLPQQGPALAAMFNTVDSFDTHATIPEYFASMDKAAAGKTAAIISAGWDPGLFSLLRLFGAAVFPDGGGATFWGRGVSQGHSDALRRVTGVKNAVQYTVPLESAKEIIRGGGKPEPDAKRTHRRECYVVPEDGANLEEIERAIRQMPHYFAGYETDVNFITQEEMHSSHAGMPHAGSVFGTALTGAGNRHITEFAMRTDSNPEFTASIMAAYARAAVRLAREGSFGAKTVFDIPFSYLSPKDNGILIRELL